MQWVKINNNLVQTSKFYFKKKTDPITRLTKLIFVREYQDHYMIVEDKEAGGFIDTKYLSIIPQMVMFVMELINREKEVIDLVAVYEEVKKTLTQKDYHSEMSPIKKEDK